MAGAALLAAGGAAAVAGVTVLRVAWAAPRRSTGLNAAGWGLIILAAIIAAMHSGAWGIAVAALIGMGAALLFLTHAALGAPAATAKASNRRANMLPQPGEPLRLGGRVVTFLIVVPLAGIVTAALAIPLRWATLLLGASDADALVIALTAVPLVWTVLAYVLLMEPRRGKQWRTLLVSAAIAAIGIVGEVIA